MIEKIPQENKEIVETKEKLLGDLREAIYSGNKKMLLEKLNEMVLSFHPDLSDPENYESEKETLENVIKIIEKTPSEFQDKEYGRLGILDIIKAFEQERKAVYFFFSGTAGERFYFDGKNKTMFYPGYRLNDEYSKRFKEIYGDKVDFAKKENDKNK